MKGLIAINIESDRLEEDVKKLVKKHKLVMVPLMLGTLDEHLKMDCWQKQKKGN